MADFLIYQNEQGEFHWYLVADNGSKIAGSEKGFQTLDACNRSIQAVKDLAPDADVSERTDLEKIAEIQLREVGAIPAANNGA